MTTTPKPNAGLGKKHALFGAGALVALLAFSLLRGGESKRPRPHAEAREDATSAPVAVTPAPAKPAPQAAPEAPAPVIDAIELEKKEVCRGEENLVTVKAHTVDGTDGDLRVVVGGTPGDRVPLRAAESHPMLNGKPAPRPRVMVIGKNGKVTIAEVPAYTVKECREEHSALVKPRLLANTWGKYAFDARIVDAAGEPFRPTSYRWTFGDGESETTTEPTVEHDYEQRQQDRIDSLMLVSVEARDAGGRVVRGRASLPLYNAAYEAFAKKGLVQLLVALDPRFPELGADGVVRQGVRLRHIHGRAAHVEHVLATEVRKDGTETVREVPPESLGVAEIPAGDGVGLDLALDTRAHPDLTMVRYELTGRTDDDDPVIGAFAVMRPTPAPTRESATPLTDPRLLARVKLARGMLGRPVTDDDLKRLASEGAFAALEAEEKKGHAVN